MQPNAATRPLVERFIGRRGEIGLGERDAFKPLDRRRDHELVEKPDGVHKHGIEEHRGRSDKPQDPKAKDGYVREDYAIAMAKKAGFVLVGSSEINANPKDTKDWVDGVWTLPPTLSQKDKDREKYLAVGEADNFVLKFQKPKS